jgi:hypothetical protein
MADGVTHRQTTNEPVPDDTCAVKADEPFPSTDDPGGARTKGYSAAPGPEVSDQDEGPVPLAPAHNPPEEVQQHERDDRVVPTGRSDEGGYSPNDRLMGSDR